MPPYRPAAAGQPLAIPAADYNAMLAAARAHEGGRPDPFNPRGGLRPAVTVLVRNDTGAALGQFCPVRLGAALIVPLADLPHEAAGEPAFAGLACDGAGVHAVLQEALPAGAIGRAAVQGCTVARVPSGAAALSFAQPPAGGNAALVAGGGYARLVTPATAIGGLTLALVLIGTGGGGGDWETYKVVSGEDCDYTLKRVVPDPAGGCKWVETADPEVAAHRMVSVNVPPKIDPDQMTLARPKPGVPGEYEMYPWGSVQKNWACNQTTGLPEMPFWCIPNTMHVLIGSCKLPVVVEDWKKVGYKASGRDFDDTLVTKIVEDCDEPFDPDDACPGVEE